MVNSDFLHALAIFASAFVLEDLAVLGAALLAVNSMISLPWAVGSSFAGIWIGDLGLYVIARFFGRAVFDRPWFKLFFRKKPDLSRSEHWFEKHGTAAIVISRAAPGTRPATYLAAGLLKVAAGRFFVITAAACAMWVALLFGASYHVGMMAISEFQMFRSEAGKLLACTALAGLFTWLLRKAVQIRGWEFWPAWIFYIPVGVKYLFLALKYRSLSLPTSANPGIYGGGVIGESKYETLADLLRHAPEVTVKTHLVPFRSIAQQTVETLRFIRENRMRYPIVLKPDVGQRGFGFKLIHAAEEVETYVRQFTRDLLIQEYAPGPHEAGIFYYRLPSESRGKIFAITEKVFPEVKGDGVKTLEELVRADARASLAADTYLKRFAGKTRRVLAAGKVMRLVEAGNHCQGAIFLDGASMNSPELETRIDEISQAIRGFYVGRYDVRYSSEEALRRGQFQIVELNGVTSEATSIYDPKNSLSDAYRTLFRQWEIVFRIADENRKRGVGGAPITEIWREWRRYQRQTQMAPVSD